MRRTDGAISTVYKRFHHSPKPQSLKHSFIQIRHRFPMLGPWRWILRCLVFLCILGLCQGSHYRCLHAFGDWFRLQKGFGSRVWVQNKGFCLMTWSPGFESGACIWRMLGLACILHSPFQRGLSWTCIRCKGRIYYVSSLWLGFTWS